LVCGARRSSHNVSLQESLQKCARWDECTAVLFESQNRKAKFCQGYRNVKKNPPSKCVASPAPRSDCFVRESDEMSSRDRFI
jgi:hypothetical protein